MARPPSESMENLFQLSAQDVLKALEEKPLFGYELAKAVGIDFDSKTARRRLAAIVAPLLDDGRVGWEVTGIDVRFEKIEEH